MHPPSDNGADGETAVSECSEGEQAPDPSRRAAHASASSTGSVASTSVDIELGSSARPARDRGRDHSREREPETSPSPSPETRSDPMAPLTSTGPQLAYSRSHHRQRLREATDRELLLALEADDESALDELIERKMGPLLKTVQRILGDAEESRDIVQVTFFRLWEHRKRYDAKWSPNTWIYRIATNLAIDQLRSRQSRQRAAEPVRLHIQSVHEGRYRPSRCPGIPPGDSCGAT